MFSSIKSKLVALYLVLVIFFLFVVGGYLLYALEETAALTLEDKLSSLLIIFALLLLISVIIILWFATNNIVRPLLQIKNIMSKVKAGQTMKRTVDLFDDEIGMLGQNLNDMLDTLEERTKVIKKDKKRLEAVIENIPGAVLFLDKYRKILLVNYAAENLLNLKRPFLLEQRIEKVIRNPLVIEQVDKIMQKETSQLQGEVIFPYPLQRVMKMAGSPVYSGEGEIEGLIIFFHDITEIRYLEKVRRDFIANVSHELRTPVTSVKGYAETLLDGALEDKTTAREFTEIIDREAGRLSRLITELFELSRLESQQVNFELESVELVETMKKVVQNSYKKAKEKNITINFLSPEPTLFVQADADKLQQVLNNLLENAIKYSFYGEEIVLSFTRFCEKENEVMIWVEDKGPGLPPAELLRVFERFYRLEKGRSRKQGGTGLGLAIVKHIVESHGGRVWAENNPDGGAKFFFTLLLAKM